MTTPKRKTISKKLRFEVFKRDSFQCQYCGRSAPEVTLEVDHLEPVKEGGQNTILNLVTSCADCNSGKGARKLSDKTQLSKQLDQLKELNERREQLKMMIKWRDELQKLEKDKIDYLAKRWGQLLEDQYYVNENGVKNLTSWLKKYTLQEIADAMETSAGQYLRRENKSATITKESAGKAFDYIPRICSFKNISANNPELKELYYIRGIIRNRFAYCNDQKAIALLKTAHDCGADVPTLKAIAMKVSNWTQWCQEMQRFQPF